MDVEQQNLEYYTKDAEAVKNAVLDCLVENGTITQADSDYYQENYGIVLVNTAWYKRIFSKDKGWFFNCIKLTEN